MIIFECCIKVECKSAKRIKNFFDQDISIGDFLYSLWFDQLDEVKRKYTISDMKNTEIL
jgi:hypothetical protein